MRDLLHDLRYGVRTLLKSPGFTLVAVIALALGIGANTAMFGIVNAVLLRPVPYPQPDRLLKLYSSGRGFHQGSVLYPNFLDWQRSSRSFQEMAAYRTDNFNLTGQANPERLRGAMASARVFAVLGTAPDRREDVHRRGRPARRGAGRCRDLDAVEDAVRRRPRRSGQPHHAQRPCVHRHRGGAGR